MDVDQRFDSKWKLDPVTGCHLWVASVKPNGYGQFAVTRTNGKKVVAYAHRWSYQRKYGMVPPRLVLDHYVCDTKHCVNPEHVRPVSQRENTLRSDSPASYNPRKTHCPQGHEYTKENTSLWQGKRKCRTCSNARARKSRG